MEMDLPPDLWERRRKIRTARRDLEELTKTCPHVMETVKEQSTYSTTIEVKCKVCGTVQAHDHGWTCEKSPDGICHYYTDTDRDGVRCVVLTDGTMDHNFPRTEEGSNWEWHPDYETDDMCLYCGEPEERK